MQHGKEELPVDSGRMKAPACGSKGQALQSVRKSICRECSQKDEEGGSLPEMMRNLVGVLLLPKHVLMTRTISCEVTTD